MFKENQSGKADGVWKVPEASPKAIVTGPTHDLGMAPGQSGTSAIERKKHVSKEKYETLADQWDPVRHKLCKLANYGNWSR